ncbi:MAG: DUF3850 domain-containing protein [Brachymonas sp.]|nr:DUF3850 domain-containing protein [Brachymonas sp.]
MAANTKIEWADHNLKLQQPHFEEVARGAKPFEIRFDDRGYKSGHRVCLREWTGAEYTGRNLTATIGAITTFAQRKGYVVFGLLDVMESRAGQ